MNKTRVQELITNINAFGKETYHKSEILDEMLKLQSEIVNLTFNGDHATLAELKIYDVERHLEQLNEECGHVADEELQKFVNGSKELCNLIKAEISGRRGETKAFRTLEYLRSQNVVLKNVELEDGELRTELDAVVITPKCITIVEVKNTSKNIFIDEDGNYYRTGEYLKWDCDIAGKMLAKETLLRKVLTDKGITNVRIQGVVVFTNNRIEVQNKCSALSTCFVSQLSYMIDDFEGDQIFNVDDMNLIKEAVETAECKEYYPADLDVEQYKMDFATVMAKIETASTIRQEKTEAKEEKGNAFMDVMKTIFSSKYVRYASGAFVGFAFTLASEVIINSLSSRR